MFWDMNTRRCVNRSGLEAGELGKGIEQINPRRSMYTIYALTTLAPPQLMGKYGSPMECLGIEVYLFAE